MANLKDLIKSYVEILGVTEQRAEELVRRNFDLALQPSKRVIAGQDLERLRPTSEVMDDLTRLHGNYIQALQQEIDFGVGLSQERIKVLQNAIQQPTMNLSLISSVQEREALKTQFKTLLGLSDQMSQGTGGVFGVMGYPSVPIPSGNPRKISALMMTPGTEHPIDILLSGRTVNIDPLKPKFADAVSIGFSGIPTPQYMQSLIEQRRIGQMIPQEISDKISSGQRIRFMSVDIETTGVGNYDIARSVAGDVYTLHAPGQSVANAVAGMSADPSQRVGFNLVSPELDNLVIHHNDRGMNPTNVRLGTATAQKEGDKMASLLRGRPDEIFDLADPTQRTLAANAYHNLFSTMAADDVYLVGNNAAAFDIPKLVQSVAQLEEFSAIDGSDELIQKVMSKVADGKILDVTQMSGVYLQGKLTERLVAAGIDPSNMEAATDFARRTLIAPQVLANAGNLGEGVKPRSMENLILSTNIVELLEQEPAGSQARKVLDALTQGGATHTADVDQFFSMQLLKRMISGELDLLPSGYSQSTLASAVRATVSGSKAVVATTNVSGVDHLSDNLLRAVNSDKELLKGTISVKTRGGQAQLAFNQSTGQFEETFIAGPRLGRVVPRGENYAINRMQLELSRELNNRARGIDSANAISTSMTFAEVSQIDTALDSVSRLANISPIVSRSATGAAIDVGSLTAPQREAFLDSLLSTRRHLGLPYMHEQVAIGGEYPLVNAMAGRYETITDAQRQQALTSIRMGGAGLEEISPDMRRRFVAISALTSDVPFDLEGEAIPTQMLSRMGVITSATDIATESDALQSAALRSRSVSKQLSELGVVFARSQEKTSLLATSEKAVRSKPMISAKMLQALEAQDPQLLKRLGLTKAHLSIVEGQDRVNLVLGSGRMSKESAKELSDSIRKLWNLNSSLTEEELVEKGLAGTVEEASRIKTALRAASASGTSSSVTQSKDVFDDLAEILAERGPVIGSIEGGAARGVEQILLETGASSSNDLVAVQRGLVFDVNEIGDQYVAVTMSQTKDVQRVLEAVDPASARRAAAQSGRSAGSAGGQYETFVSALKTAHEDPDFHKKLSRNLSSARLDSGLFGTSFGKSRAVRDEKILNFITKAKPKMAIGALGVAAFSAGYYIARKNRKDQMYDEVMHQQPYEERGLVQDANYNTQADTQIYSARRDPLVTAGVVGNLDRNKIGHTKMGPNKYDYLYGR